ncbi:DNA damage-inducible transcript 3 protein [Apteryx rowi]|uniref:DNA damage-inducible transcript 3 protein n=1 Tax=Apteryx rowi TaxID=308060 RepID=UPI000E1D01D8|nr:DNA damage-inducible transcript 3 protein [Apteryx rowi]
MAAESLPLAGAAGPSALPGWELEAWYQDLQEVLAAAEPGGHHLLPRGAEQEGPAELATLDSTALLWSADGAGAAGCELDAALAAELLELLGPESAAGTEPAAPPPGSASSGSSPAQTGTEDEEGAALGRGAKRKRHGGEATGREPAKRREREQANEQRVLELTAHNERLREEIQRLSAEVERTRAALIDRIVNLRRT